MSKNNKPATSEVIFRYGDLFNSSLASAAASNPSVRDKLKDFLKTKADNPIQSYGANDKPMVSGTPFDTILPKARKAHLTHNFSIIYEVSGRNPTYIVLDGIFGHDELGFGNPPNPKKSKNVATRLRNARP